MWCTRFPAFLYSWPNAVQDLPIPEFEEKKIRVRHTFVLKTAPQGKQYYSNSILKKNIRLMQLKVFIYSVRKSGKV